jgi:hypothetical protein
MTPEVVEVVEVVEVIEEKALSRAVRARILERHRPTLDILDSLDTLDDPRPYTPRARASAED